MELFNGTQFDLVQLYLWLHTFVGAFILYILNKLNRKDPFSFLTALNMPTEKPIVILFDIFISSLLGAIVVFPLTNPVTAPQAIIAGLGMTGILSTYTKNTGVSDGKA
jgi:archaellum biogenesis protein FlaJ (TadC family)